MSEQVYDVTIIGAGPGGYVAAIRAAQLGLKVAIVEKENLGGVCLNWGCIPTKALLRNAEVVSLLGEGKEFGFSVSDVTVDYAAAVKRSRQVSSRLVKGIGGLMKKNDVDVVIGAAVLKSASEVEVTNDAGESQTLQPKNVIIATGARAFTIPAMEPDGEKLLTSRVDQFTMIDRPGGQIEIHRQLIVILVMNAKPCRPFAHRFTG